LIRPFDFSIDQLTRRENLPTGRSAILGNGGTVTGPAPRPRNAIFGFNPAHAIGSLNFPLTPDRTRQQICRVAEDDWNKT
jgi:hypothetical protein